MPLILSLLLATAFPSKSHTSWMRPESFHLVVGMPRAEAMRALDRGGWKVEKGKTSDEAFVDYTPTKSLTLQFHKDRLHSIRFELFLPLANIGAAFKEEKAFLREKFGAPKEVAPKSMLIYDTVLPNVMAVLTDDPKSQNGKNGFGVLVVRYFDPISKE